MTTDTRPWHEDERFWETFRDAMFPPEKFEDAPDEVDALLDLVDRNVDVDSGERRSVLDVPCGVGRHSREFARRGFDVTGVDATAAFVEEARERAREAGLTESTDAGPMESNDDGLTERDDDARDRTAAPDRTDGEPCGGDSGRVEFVEADMRSFRREDGFDLAVNYFTSFGYFEDREDDERVARNVFESLRPGGAFVLDLAGKETLARDFSERTWQPAGEGYVLEEHVVTDDWTWMENTWVLVADGETHEFDVSHRLYSAYELRTLLESVGFGDVSAYGDYDGTPYDDDAERLLVVATK